MAVPKSEYSTNFDAAAAKKSMGHYQRINILFAFTLGMMAFLESVIGVIREIRREFCHIEKQVSIPAEGGAIRRDCTCTAGAPAGCS